MTHPILRTRTSQRTRIRRIILPHKVRISLISQHTPNQPSLERQIKRRLKDVRRGNPYLVPAFLDQGVNRGSVDIFAEPCLFDGRGTLFVFLD